MIDGHPITRSKAAEILQVTRERVRQLEHLGLLEGRLKNVIGPMKPWAMKKMDKKEYKRALKTVVLAPEPKPEAEPLPPETSLEWPEMEEKGLYDIEDLKLETCEPLCKNQKQKKPRKSSVPRTGTTWKS